MVIIYDITGLGAWQAVYAMLAKFSMTLQTKILSTGTSAFLKQIIFIKSFNSVLYMLTSSQNYSLIYVQHIMCADSQFITLICYSLRETRHFFGLNCRSNGILPRDFPTLMNQGPGAT